MFNELPNKIFCDRGQHYVTGKAYIEGTDIFTAGFYIVDVNTPWHKYAKEGEHIICDLCMWRDKKFRKDYPDTMWTKKIMRELHFVSTTCVGERCRMCWSPATHKVGEEIASDDTIGNNRHNFTAYVCCNCFRIIFGDAVFCDEK